MCSFSYASAAHPALHSFPTRRSSDLSFFHPRQHRHQRKIDFLVNRGEVLLVDLFTQQARELASDVGSLGRRIDRKSTRLNSSHVSISYAVFCLKKKKSSHARHSTPTH